MVYGISVAEKKIVWLKLRARRGPPATGSQPDRYQYPNDRLVKALARLFAEPAARPQPRRCRASPPSST